MAGGGPTPHRSQFPSGSAVGGAFIRALRSMMTGAEEERQASGFTKVLLLFRTVQLETVAHVAVATVPGHRGLKER